ncbi:VOC family protein [Marisediminicola sp. LYQ85]|uniref:VOC family protein n=1 Tax=Marisediminicola sp. LYQ85 TaxID=3391062 RepID=UPI003983CFE8
MTTTLNPYLALDGRAREAIEFYRRILGGDPELSTYGDYGMGDADEADKIMHAQLTTPAGLVLMVSDTPSGTPLTVGDSISISLSGDDLDELTGYWTGLSEGGTEIEPFVAAPWGDTFGICRDRFGVTWMVNATEKGGAD